MYAVMVSFRGIPDGLSAERFLRRGPEKQASWRGTALGSSANRIE